MTKKTRGVGLILYGDPGIGKTGLALQFPKPARIISCNETGAQDLIDAGEVEEDMVDDVEANHWKDLLDLVKSSTDVSTLIIDSLSGVAQFMQADILYKVYNNQTDAFGSFSQGWRIEGIVWAEELEERLTYLRSKGVNIILIGHKRMEVSKNVVAEDYKSAHLDMEKWPRGVFTKWAQAVLFMTMDFETRATKLWKGKVTESKVKEGLDEVVDRVIYTQNHPSHDAKNRLSLPPVIDMGRSAAEAYNNLVTQFPTKIKSTLIKEESNG